LKPVFVAAWGRSDFASARLARAVADDVARNTFDDITGGFLAGLQKPIPAMTDD
jgi:hypothetical protein